MPQNHEIVIHEESYTETHVVLPPIAKYSEAEREEARQGVSSLEFLRKTMHDPAPPLRSTEISDSTHHRRVVSQQAAAGACREAIQRGLVYLNTTIAPSGAWHCIRFNIAKPEIPRHYERPPFISAFCTLALASSEEALAQSICQRSLQYIADTIEYPGLWRYYRHLPNDFDSTSLCSLALESHPWMMLHRNVPDILRNRDVDGLFLTWIPADDEPKVVAPFRIEADPVVNANLIAYLGDRSETKAAQRWLEEIVANGDVLGASKWYPDPIAVYYAISRAIVYVPTVFQDLKPALTEQILDLRDQSGKFSTILQAAQAVSTLYNIGNLQQLDASLQMETIIESQRDDGSWPEILAFGDQSLQWGTFGQIGHASESVTGAFCVEALERLSAHFGN